MSDAPLILGVSGLRGIVGESLTPEVAVRYAGAIAAWLWKQQHGDVEPTVVLCRDGRNGGESIHSIVRGSLLASGCQVIDAGIAMTPTAGVLVAHHLADAAIIITASHNPSEWNGIKLVVRDGKITESELDQMTESEVIGFQDQLGAAAPSARVANELIEQFNEGTNHWVDQNQVGSIQVEHHADRTHVVYVAERVVQELFHKYLEPLPQSFVVCLDSVNCSGATPAEMLCRKLGSRSVQLFGDGSGIFPHTPEPTKENLSGEGGLCDAVPGLKADVGFAQDPDADRLAIVDEIGEYIGEEYTLVLCAMALMEARVGQGGSGDGKPVFVVNLSTSRMIDDVAKHYGGEVVRTAVGEANVVEAMKSLKASGRDVVLGGEGNGGVIWPEVTYVRDSLSGMALALSLMARTGKTVSELVEMVNGLGPTDEVKANGYTIIKKKSALAKKSDADPVVEHLRGIYEGEGDCRVDLQDGIRIDWDAKGVWAHVRASNTEPIMRVIVEAPSSAEAESVAAAIDGQIGEVGEGTSH